jgi:hypothetical protein
MSRQWIIDMRLRGAGADAGAGVGSGGCKEVDVCRGGSGLYGSHLAPEGKFAGHTFGSVLRGLGTGGPVCTMRFNVA